MESVTKPSMWEILNECLKDSNLETVSKAELRKKYLEKTGLTKLSHEDKKLFASAVNTAYLNYIANKSATADIADKTKIDAASDDEIKENNEDWKLVMSSSSDDDITLVNIKENVVNDQFTNGENHIKETSDDEIKKNNEHKKLIMDSSPCNNISPKSIQENVDDDKIVNGVNNIEMESTNDFDENSVVSHKNNIVKKSLLASTINGFKRQRGKRTLISSSEDEIIQLKPTKRSKVLKKAKRSSDLEGQHITKSEEKKNVSKSKDHFKRAKVESSDSEDELLCVFQKKTNSLTKSDESENECLSKFMKKQFSNPVDSEDESIMSSNKKKTKFINDSKNHSNGEKMELETKLKSNGSQKSMKSKDNSSDSEDEPLTKYRKSNKNTYSFNRESLNSSDKFSRSFENTSESEDESLAKYSKKKLNNSIHSDEEPLTSLIYKSNSVNNSLKSMKNSSDSENEPLNLNNENIDNSNDYYKKPVEKIVKRKVKHSTTKSITNDSRSVEETIKKKTFVDSDDDSDKQPIAKKSDPVSRSLKSVKISSDSEEEAHNNLRNKKMGNSKDYKKKPVANIVKGKVKHSLKKPKNSKSKEQTLKKKKFVDSDEEEDEPLSNVKNESNNCSDSEDNASISYQKKGKYIDGQKNSLSSDSCEDEPLSNIKRESKSSSDSEDEPLSNIKRESKSSSGSEDEPLNKLSSKKSDKKRKNSESGSSSFVDENKELSCKKNKSSKRKEANDSGKQGKKRPSASENKIEHLKKYLRVAGIRISNYNKLFENCKTMKGKCEKMMSLLEKEGLKGRPTLEKCKKLRVKIETKREIAELDVSNILKEGGGRPKRSVCSDTTNCKQEEKSTPIKKFSRLQDIVDSEESD